MNIFKVFGSMNLDDQTSKAYIKLKSIKPKALAMNFQFFFILKILFTSIFYQMFLLFICFD